MLRNSFSRWRYPKSILMRIPSKQLQGKTHPRSRDMRRPLSKSLSTGWMGIRKTRISTWTWEEEVNCPSSLMLGYPTISSRKSSGRRWSRPGTTSLAYISTGSSSDGKTTYEPRRYRTSNRPLLRMGCIRRKWQGFWNSGSSSSKWTKLLLRFWTTLSKSIRNRFSCHISNIGSKIKMPSKYNLMSLRNSGHVDWKSTIKSWKTAATEPCLPKWVEISIKDRPWKLLWLWGDTSNWKYIFINSKHSKIWKFANSFQWGKSKISYIWNDDRRL